METAYLSLGSNLGDRELNLLRAVAEIGRIAGLKITALSRFYETDPVGPIPQDPFLNAAMKVETTLSPEQMLKALQRIETETFQRRRQVAWGPRTMDIDILFFGDRTVADEKLVIPHPRLHQRRFVLAPLAEIAPELVHPLFRQTVAELLATLGDGQGVRPL
jgi:2-amino-4-hydroxy-6-hydroxymethyldihydropteridine diphosphokinase